MGSRTWRADMVPAGTPTGRVVPAAAPPAMARITDPARGPGATATGRVVPERDSEEAEPIDAAEPTDATDAVGAVSWLRLIPIGSLT